MMAIYKNPLANIAITFLGRCPWACCSRSLPQHCSATQAIAAKRRDGIVTLVLRLLLVIAALGGGYHLWGEYREHRAIAGIDKPERLPAGAHATQMRRPAPCWCSRRSTAHREAAQRVYRKLAQELTQLGIPNVQTSKLCGGQF